MLYKFYKNTNYIAFIKKDNKNLSFFYLFNKKNNMKYVFKLPRFSVYKVVSNKEIVILFPRHFSKKNSFLKIQNFLINFQKELSPKNNFSKKLILKGLGFKYEFINKRFLKIYLSYSHPYYLYVPHNLILYNTNNQTLVVSCQNKMLLNNFTEVFLKIRKPSILKNKGIFFHNLS